MTLSKNITGKSWAVSFMAVTLLMAAVAPYAAYADSTCVDGSSADIDENLDVDGFCVISGNVNGNISLTDSDDQFG